MLPPEDRSRPTANRAASNVNLHDDTISLEHRCRECRHPLSAPKSIAAGLGPVCLKRKINGWHTNYDARIAELEADEIAAADDYAEFIFGLRKHNKRAGMRLIQGGAA